MYRLIRIGSVVFLQGLRPYMYPLPVRHMFYSSSRNTRNSVVGYAHKKKETRFISQESRASPECL